MNVLVDLFSQRRRGLLKVLMAFIVLISLIVPFQPTTTFAAGHCQSSVPVSAAYTLQVCITAPAEGATISGSRTVTATVTVTGIDPGITKLIFYLDGEYLITDYQSPYTFVLPTTKWVDGSRLLDVEVVMRDGFISQRASIVLNFNNGIVQPPVNTNTFTPKRGRTPAAGQPFVLAATGDGADGATHAGNVTDLIASWNPNLFLYLGDVYDEGTPTEFRNWYGTTSTFYGRFRSITNPVIGNHEYSAGGVAPGYFDYWDNVPRYYSYNAGGWHFIALDSNCGLLPVCAVGQAQYQWLQNDLSTNSNICTIAYFHHPVYNIGPEGPATRMNDIWALLAQSGVDIVMAGHDHNYQRWRPLDGSGAVSATGTTQFVAGGGGHGTQQFITSDSRLAVGFDTTPNAFGALRLQLNQSGASYQYINTAGTTLDSGSISCSGAPADTTAPSKPTSLQATAVSPQLVRLTWTASTDNVGVTGYSIYRNGALLTTIGPATSFDDATVQPGTAYSYQIRAQDAAGNMSSLSSTATVTTSLLLFSDGFESGNLSQWTSVSGLTVQQQQVYAGLYGARAISTGTAAYAYQQLSQTQNELYYRLWFNILSQGTNSVYLQRFRTGSNGAIMGVFISSTGKLAYRNDVTGVVTTSTTVVPRGTWHELQVHVRINGTASSTEIWLDGTRINDLSKTENLGTTAIGRIQLGDSSSGSTFNVALDRVALSTQFIDSSNPPEGGPLPTPAPSPTPTPTVSPGTGQVQVSIGGMNQGNISVSSGQTLPQTYSGITNGPVKVIHLDGEPIFVSERSLYGPSFNEVMGYPANRFATEYWFPWYDQVYMNTWILVGNPSTTKTAYVNIYIAGTKQNGTYAIPPSGRILPQFPGIVDGPVRVVSVTGSGTSTPLPIFASERSLYGPSFNEVMGYPANQFTTEYWFPWYDQVYMNTWILVGNPSATKTAYVDIYVAGTKQNSTYVIPPSGSITPQFNLSSGPVHVVSVTGPGTATPLNIFTSERAVYGPSFNEVMGYPGNRLSSEYWFPWYDNVGMTTELMIGKP